jgi:hypothetical protein
VCVSRAYAIIAVVAAEGVEVVIRNNVVIEKVAVVEASEVGERTAAVEVVVVRSQHFRKSFSELR